MNDLSMVINACRLLLEDYPSAENARIYLDKRLSRETQAKFEFGYFPNIESIESLTALTSENVLIDQELLFKDIHSGKISFSPLSNHNLVMPYKNVYGKIIAIVGRTLLNDEQRQKIGLAKYKNTVFKKSRNLFGLFESKESIINMGFAYVVEGQFDVIKAHEKNITNVVALGSSNMSFEQLALLLRYTNNLKLLLDSDEAGMSGRQRIVEKFGKYVDIKNKYIPGGFKDLDELLSETDIVGVDQLEKVLS